MILIIGVGTFFICVFLFICAKVAYKKYKKKNGEADNGDRKEKKEKKKEKKGDGSSSDDSSDGKKVKSKALPTPAQMTAS